MTAHVVLAPAQGQSPEAPAAQRVASQARGARDALSEACRHAGVIRGPLDTDERDAPIPFDGVHWSLTHTRAWVAAALDCEPVGVDVEALRLPRGPRESALDDAERALFADAPLELAFARCWTAKEAVLKQAGVGLLELERCRLVEVRADGSCRVEHRGLVHLVHQRALPGPDAAERSGVDRIAHVLAVCARGPVLWHGLPSALPEFGEVLA